MARGLGRPAAASWGPTRLDVFVRRADGSLLHWSEDGGNTAVVRLEGALASDPVAVARAPGGLDVFARGADQSLLHWSWDASLARMVGPDNWGWVATDPVAISWRPGQVDVFATSVDGPLRHWQWPVGGARPVPVLADGGRGVRGRPVPISHAPDRLDVFFWSDNEGQLEQWQWNGTTLAFVRFLGGRLISDPVAVSWAPLRIDVYGRVDDGRMRHWGWDGFLTGKWFGPEQSVAEILVANPAAATHGEHEVDLFARTANATLQHWSWDGAARAWVGPVERATGLASDPIALSREEGSVDVFARAEDGGLLHWTKTSAAWISSHRSLAEPPPPEVPWPADQAGAPDLLLVRPKDHVVLGVHWSDCQLVDEVPPVLEPTSSAARVVLTFPPQHVAEEVAAADGPLVPTIDPSTTGGFSVWQARLARPSRVAFSVPADARIVLTAQGLLEALDGATVLPGSRDPADDLTAIDLPSGLIVGPESTDPAVAVQARHPARPVEGDSGATGLWRTRLAPTDPAAGLLVRALHAGGNDPFPVPLTRAGRLTVAAQTTPPAASRLELSALGGSLSATGRWDTFEWDHEATLGRDRRVRTAARGVLYPLGHRAEYVELTERLIDSRMAEPIGVLRKRSVLTVTEAVRAEVPGDGRLARAFPFGEVEITKLVYTGLADPDWRMHPRPTLKLAELEARRDQVSEKMRRLHDEVHGDMGWGGIGPVMEDAAEVQEEAAQFLQLRAVFQAATEEMAALEALGVNVDDVPTYFWPSTGEPVPIPIRFPVRLATANGDVHIALPLLFVQDVRLPAGDLREPFFSLDDPRIAKRLKDEYTDSGAGMVDVPGIPVDLVRSGRQQRPPSDVQEVHRLNLAASAQQSSGFRPRLGVPDLPPRPDGLPDPRRWGVEVALPAVRSLLGADPAAARVALAFSATYEDVGDAADVALQMAGDAVDIDFRGAADRAGGLVAPRIAADAISRAHGLVNLAGSESLDPAQLLGEGASLLGFDLRSLLGAVTEPPAIVTDLVDGQPPVVTMTWEDVPLRPFPEPGPAVFVPGAGSTMTMTVRSSPTVNETTCEVGPFLLNMPPGAEALLELSFEGLTFTRTGGTPPTLDVRGIDARFVGKLALLQALQEGVGLGAAGPAIDVSRTGIAARYSLPVPDVSVLAFSMRNLVFHAAVTVPFTRDPVSVALGFGSRERPFALGVLMFGGGGYVDVEIVHSGLRRLEISLEFGAAVAIGIGIATAEVHAMGGIRYEMRPDRSVVLTGYLRIGGSVELLGLVSVSVELLVTLDYRSDGNRLVGRARLVIEIDLTLYSDSIEVDSGEWEIAGGAPPPEPPPPPEPLVGPLAAVPAGAATDGGGFLAWAAYREAFRS
jgi:hypothetical protein